VPLFGKSGDVVGVLDIDSPKLSRFSEDDKAGLEDFARIIEKII
jgi:GAF domain-containing protein